ncbi:MAG: hypothetical protein JXL97_11075 [Bacteroidales bacterium]|nr:hypothetical protein [Bacteroidales bacterium]
MKTKQFLFSALFLITIALLVNACATAYTPNVVNVPLLNNKTETQISLHAGMNGTDAQVTYAATKNIGVMVNYSYKNNTSDSSSSFHSHNFIEGGIGYYTVFSKQGHFELFAGYGMGNVEALAETSISSSYVNATFQRIFIQPDFGFSSSFFDIGFSPRVVYVIMKPEQFQYSSINNFFVEPTGIMRFGFKYFFFTSQVGVSLPLQTIESSDWFNYNPFIMSFGMQIKLFKIYDQNARY